MTCGTSPRSSACPTRCPRLASQGIACLADVDGDCCEAYLAHRRYLLDENGHVVGERSPATRRAAAQVVADLVSHRELFTTDRVPEDLRPWGGPPRSGRCQPEPPGQDHAADTFTRFDRWRATAGESCCQGTVTSDRVVACDSAMTTSPTGTTPT